MLPTDTLPNISAARILHLASLYQSAISTSLHKLETIRQTTLPSKIKSERQGKARSGKSESLPCLSKEDLVSLTEWKLKRGKFRPTLMKLVTSNDERVVQETTARAFSMYIGSSPDESQDFSVAKRQVNAKKAMKILTELKGVGPATASLMLSVFDTENVPFFSDELFMWSMSSGNDGNAKKDVPVWNGKMAYTDKEYALLFEKVQQLRERVKEDDKKSVSAFDVELAAWVIVKGFATEDEGGRTTISAPGDELEKAAESTSLKRKTPSDETGAAKRRKSETPRRK